MLALLLSLWNALTGQKPAPAPAPPPPAPKATPTPPPPVAPKSAAVAEEFNDAAGAHPSPALWSYHLTGTNGGPGMTDYIRNAATDGQGNLAITAIRENATDPRLPGVTVAYTSAALHTKGKLEAQYGTWSARIQFPLGRGNHPTFALFGKSYTVASDWPACGEVDIMEIQDTLQGVSVNGPGYDFTHGTQISTRAPSDVRGQWHVYACQHEKDKITVLLDGKPIRVITPADLPKGATWVFNQPMFAWLQLDLGSLPGNLPAGQPFPQKMLVDWFRYDPPST